MKVALALMAVTALLRGAESGQGAMINDDSADGASTSQVSRMKEDNLAGVTGGSSDRPSISGVQGSDIAGPSSSPRDGHLNESGGTNEIDTADQKKTIAEIRAVIDSYRTMLRQRDQGTFDIDTQQLHVYCQNFVPDPVVSDSQLPAKSEDVGNATTGGFTDMDIDPTNSQLRNESKDPGAELAALLWQGSDPGNSLLPDKSKVPDATIAPLIDLDSADDDIQLPDNSQDLGAKLATVLNVDEA